MFTPTAALVRHSAAATVDLYARLRSTRRRWNVRSLRFVDERVLVAP
jgi:hypothetical protein